jgi:hypothetical protein
MVVEEMGEQLCPVSMEFPAYDPGGRRLQLQLSSLLTTSRAQ